jgi:RNA polymerase sigma-70 factor (ECF subfamily)
MSVSDEQEIAAFSDLVSVHRSRVFGYIYAMLHNMSDAEDIYQQTTLLMWQKFSDFQPGSDFGSWALKIAYHNIKNFQRSMRRRHVFFSDAVMEKVLHGYETQTTKDAENRLDALGNCVQRLPKRHQHILKRRYAESVSIRKLAIDEGKTEAAMAMLLSRLRKTIFRCVQAHIVPEY